MNVSSMSDNFTGGWLEKVRCKDFCFRKNIHLYAEMEVEAENVFIHKYIVPGGQHLSIKYHVINATEKPGLVFNNEV